MTNYITLIQTAGTKSFYFDEFDPTEDWEDNGGDVPANMVDSNIKTFAATFVDGRVQLCDSNTCAETGDEAISKVEIRAFSGAGSYSASPGVAAYLRPVFSGGDGDNHSWEPPDLTEDTPAEWGTWFDITNDTNAPATWTWSDVTSMNVDHYPDFPVGGSPWHLKTAKIEVRVTYASSCSLIVPYKVSTNHAQNIKMMNMWNGDRVVFGLSRSRWTLTLRGRDWENNACDKVNCIKNLGLVGNPVNISGLNNSNWDTEWMIRSFGWKLVTENPIHYEWILLLERT